VEIGNTNLDLEAYRTALETRNFEIGLFWQRSNYFLVLNTAIGTGFFVVESDELELLLSLLGLGAAVLWLCVNLGSKFWQARWEHRLELTEAALKPAFADFFSADWPTLRSDVEASFAVPYGTRGRWDRRLWRWGVLQKPSVSLMMTYLSLAFILFWVGAVAIQLVRGV
jgi:hypothetical protein